MGETDHDEDFEPCDCADRVPATLTEEWVCPKCDAIWCPEEDEGQ